MVTTDARQISCEKSWIDLGIVPSSGFATMDEYLEGIGHGRLERK